MNSSGMKRGLAATAISALAVTGLPFLATSASASPNSSTVGAGLVVMDAPGGAVTAVSTENDGTNTSVSLASRGGAGVTSVLYQYQSISSAGTWVDIAGGLVAQNADGVFKFDWANPPGDLVAVRAVPNTGAANGDSQTVGLVPNAAAGHATELGTEGNLGVFLSPYSAADDVSEDDDATPANGDGPDNKDGDYIIAKGTTSEATTPVDISAPSHSAATASTTAADADGDAGAGTTGAFHAILDISDYPATGGTPNQITLRAVTAGTGTNTDDAEGSTLYSQTITSITAVPATQDSPNTPGEITLTVKDQNGNPVANAQVGRDDIDTDGAGPDDANDADELLGYTNAKGELVVTQGGTGTRTYYANIDDTDNLSAGDPTTTATVNQYTPVTSQVIIKSRGDRTSFDLDELLDGDEFTIETRDQKGNLYNEDGNAASNPAAGDSEVEYRWIIDPSAAGEPTLTQDWQTDATDTGAVFTVPALADADLASEFNNPDGSNAAAGDLPAGTYTLEARRPDVGLAGGRVDATPANYSMGESEVSFADGDEANAPVTGDYMVDGKLALTNSGPGLAGREIPLELTAVGTPGDSKFAPQAEQPAGVTVLDNDSALVVTGANGSFSVKLDDGAVPANVTPTNETDLLTAGPAEESATDNTSLKGTNGADDAANANADATDAVTINWVPAPEVTGIDIQVNTLDPFAAASTTSTATPGPGVPVDLDITVTGPDGNDGNTNPDPVGDVPVEISVDKGFLSPNAESANDAVLDEDHDDTGDLWGYFQNDGTSQDLTTVDSGADEGETGIVAAIERDADFDDNGLVTMTVTVKAGDVTETETVTMDVRALLNVSEASLERAAGEPTGDVSINEDVDFQLYVKDQFGNLAGDTLARISDDSTVADFQTDEDLDSTLSDFTTSAPGVRAFSDAPTVQTLTATMNPGEVTVNAAGNPATGARTVMESSDPINWVKTSKPSPELDLEGNNNGGKADRLKADAEDIAAGSTVKLFKKTKNGWKKIREGVLNGKGNMRFKVADKNGKKVTVYRAKVEATDAHTADRDSKRVR